MRQLQTFLIIAVTAAGLAACGGRKAVEEDIVVETVEGNVGGSDGASASGLGGDASSLTSGLDDAAHQPLDRRVLYFAYDSSALTPESEAVIQAHVQHLAADQNVSLILEGHADERGTREYNLALGEDRAIAVANYMQALGVSPGRIQLISYGEERPASLGSDESAWALNRRVEILYQPVRLKSGT